MSRGLMEPDPDADISAHDALRAFLWSVVIVLALLIVASAAVSPR